jgi:hypothetical protein
MIQMDIELLPYKYGIEERVKLPIDGSDVVVITGNTNLSEATGNPDEEYFQTYVVRMIVGHRWETVRNVAPLVAIGGIDHPDSDVDDGSGFKVWPLQIDQKSWDYRGWA